MTRLPPEAQIDWSADGAARSAAFGDVYFSGDGLGEAREVFLKGCRLPDAWSDRSRFTIGELGFGSGLNVLAAMDLWRRTRPSASARLDILTVEGFPLSREDAARILAPFPDIADLAARLLARWPDRARGLHRIELGDGVRLTLLVGDVGELADVDPGDGVDAWFLDGFAPARNPAMWTQEALAMVARLSAPGARAATFTVAGDVRRGLAAAGFEAAKAPGHGRKRERLEAVLPGVRKGRPPPPRVILIGAGAAGANLARSFTDRGVETLVLDEADGPGAGASGNRLALVMPRLDAADSPLARALVSAHLLARRRYLSLPPDAACALDVERRPASDADRSRFARLLADPPLPAEDLTALDAGAPEQGVRIRGAVALTPARALAGLLEGAELRTSARVLAVEADETGAEVHLEGAAPIRADLVVIAAGWGVRRFLSSHAVAIEGRAGQIDSLEHTHGAASAVVDGAYVVAAMGALVAGATFEPVDPGAAAIPASPAARDHNLSVVERLRPDLAAAFAAGPLRSRASIRATTPDRLPFAGPCPGFEPSGRVRVIGGLGSHGYLWSPLLAEWIASDVLGEPAPLTRTQGGLLAPDRFAQRRRRKGRYAGPGLPLDDA